MTSARLADAIVVSFGFYVALNPRSAPEKSSRRAPLAVAVAFGVALLLVESGYGGGDKEAPSTAIPTTTPTGMTSSSSAEQTQEAKKAGSGRSEAGGGGEASIAGFGGEAGGTERATIVAAFEGYLNALAAEDPAAAW